MREASSEKVVKEGISEEAPCGQRPEGREGITVEERSISGRGNSMCKGPDMGMHLMRFFTTAGANVPGVENVGVGGRR